jgi:hypothetical protein
MEQVRPTLQREAVNIHLLDDHRETAADLADALAGWYEQGNVAHATVVIETPDNKLFVWSTNRDVDSVVGQLERAKFYELTEDENNAA